MPGGMKFDVGGPFCTGVEPIDRRSIRMSVLVDGAPPRHTPESNTSTYNATNSIMDQYIRARSAEIKLHGVAMILNSQKQDALDKV